MSVEDQIRTTVEELLKALATKNVIGEPITVEDKTLIPVTKIGVGFGAGMGGGEKGKREGGAGSGGGGGVTPVAFVAVFKGVPGPNGVKVLPLAAPSPIAKAIGEAVPAVIEKLREKKKGEKEE